MAEVAVVPSKKRKPATPKEASRRNKNMVRVSDADHAILTRLAEKHGRKLTAECHMALMDYFQKHGVAPASPGAGE